ncbi:uncharacterized protein [Physcomitrium patens]|uniref:uncharacterized protein n=1 Tax=Physcomitrium patens TaxID=3218 RepID=UPI003CCD5D9A
MSTLYVHLGSAALGFPPCPICELTWTRRGTWHWDLIGYRRSKCMPRKHWSAYVGEPRYLRWEQRSHIPPLPNSKSESVLDAFSPAGLFPHELIRHAHSLERSSSRSRSTQTSSRTRTRRSNLNYAKQGRGPTEASPPDEAPLCFCCCRCSHTLGACRLLVPACLPVSKFGHLRRSPGSLRAVVRLSCRTLSVTGALDGFCRERSLKTSCGWSLGRLACVSFDTRFWNGISASRGHIALGFNVLEGRQFDDPIS